MEVQSQFICVFDRSSRSNNMCLSVHSANFKRTSKLLTVSCLLLKHDFNNHHHFTKDLLCLRLKVQMIQPAKLCAGVCMLAFKLFV